MLACCLVRIIVEFVCFFGYDFIFVRSATKKKKHAARDKPISKKIERDTRTISQNWHVT